MNGEIKNLTAYLRAKCLDHTKWPALLENKKLSPSDIDAAIEIGGKFLFMEYNSRSALWCKIPLAQRIFHERLVSLGQGKIISALLHNHVPTDRPIDSVEDVIEFSVMYYRGGEIKLTPVKPGVLWPKVISNVFAI